MYLCSVHSFLCSYSNIGPMYRLSKASRETSMTYILYTELFPEVRRKTNIGCRNELREFNEFVAPEVSCSCFNSFLVRNFEIVAVYPSTIKKNTLEREMIRFCIYI